MANIRKRGNKWQVQIRRAGHSSITKTFLRKEEALAWGRSQEVRFDAALAGTFLPVKETLAELLGRYAVLVYQREGIDYWKEIKTDPYRHS